MNPARAIVAAEPVVGLTSLAWPVTVLVGLVLLWAFVWWFSRLPHRRQRSVERLLALCYDGPRGPTTRDPPNDLRASTGFTTGVRAPTSANASQLSGGGRESNPPDRDPRPHRF